MMDRSTKLLDLVVINDSKRLKSLQDLCRRAILSCGEHVSVFKQLDNVDKLPLPKTIKRYLTTLRIPEDIDMDHIFMEYNFNFPYHLQHKTHQIYPAVCQLDGSKVLIKVHQQIDNGTACAMCGCQEFEAADTTKMKIEQEKWSKLEHKSLQNCLAKFIEGDRLGYIFEFPEMNILNYSYQLFLMDKPFPEYMAWEIIENLTTLFLYLEHNGVVACGLGSPDHIVINEKGVVKLENMLLYLPENSTRGSVYRACLRKCFIAPEILSGKEAVPRTVTWNIGTVIKELISPIPRVVLHGNLKYINLPNRKIQRSSIEYSKDLQNIIWRCTSSNPNQRPSVIKLQTIAKYHLKNYAGPRTSFPLGLLLH